MASSNLAAALMRGMILRATSPRKWVSRYSAADAGSLRVLCGRTFELSVDLPALREAGLSLPCGLPEEWVFAAFGS